MGRKGSINNRLEAILDTRSQILEGAHALVEEAISKVTQEIQMAHGIKVFQTIHVTEYLEQMDSWQALDIGHHFLVDLIRDCGYETVHWKTPGPNSKLLKVWRKKPSSAQGVVIQVGGK